MHNLCQNEISTLHNVKQNQKSFSMQQERQLPAPNRQPLRNSTSPYVTSVMPEGTNTYCSQAISSKTIKEESVDLEGIFSSNDKVSLGMFFLKPMLITKIYLSNKSTFICISKITLSATITKSID